MSTQTVSADVDLLVVGGGINGTGIANHASQAGLSVMLVEQGDLACATSSASSKLIHGGLRYLEHREFRLVREALSEREVLLNLAPHLVWPLSFVLPHHAGLRPSWMIRLGLFLYDHLGGRKRLPGSRGLALASNIYGAPLKADFRRGFIYADCWADDARMVVANAMQCRELGGKVRTHTRFESAKRENGLWRVELSSEAGREVVHARGLVNAAGPWVERVLKQGMRMGARDSVRLVKGSHIVVPALHDGKHAYILQHHDGRIVFVLPYEDRFSLIGTTDILHKGDPGDVKCSDEEVSYLCSLVAEYFSKPPTPPDVVWRYAGVRPLYDDNADDPSSITRDYVLRLDSEGAPVLSVFGGKLTTYRQLALHAMRNLQPFFPQMQDPIEPPNPLPGGAIHDANFDTFLAAQATRYPWLDKAVLQRLAHQFGDRLERVLDGAQNLQDMGQHFGAGLYEKEVRYLIEHEWARDTTDVLWRRTKRGLHMTPNERAAVAEWLKLHT